jgi:hypothetical protein
MKRKIPRLTLIAACAVGLAGSVAAPAQAVSTTAVSATHVTIDPALLTGTAQLNGLVVTDGKPVSWVFEYGTDTTYGNFGTIGFIPAGATGAVSVNDMITDLTPGTKYHYRLDITIQTSNASYYPYSTLFSGDRTFKVPSLGLLALTSKKIPVRNGVASIGLKCSSPIACKGKLGLTLHHQGKLVTCLSKSFSLKAGKKSTVTGKLSKTCLALLASEKGLKINAIFAARLTTGQPRVSKTVLVFVKK